MMPNASADRLGHIALDPTEEKQESRGAAGFARRRRIASPMARALAVRLPAPPDEVIEHSQPSLSAVAAYGLDRGQDLLGIGVLSVENQPHDWFISL